MLERCEGFARCERVPEDADDLVGMGPVPQNMHELVEVAPEQAAGDVAEDLLRDRVDLTKTKVGVHEIDAQLRLIEERLILLRAKAEFALGLA